MSPSVSPAFTPSSSAACSESTSLPFPTSAGASPLPGSTPNAETAAVRFPPSAAAFRVRMPSGSAADTPGCRAQVCQALSSTAEPEKDTDCPSGGAANAMLSALSPVTAEVFSFPSPAVRPDSSPTSSVISTTTVPMRANLPLANRRSLHATNMLPGSGPRPAETSRVGRGRHQPFD